jgi:hypothetical protein
MKTRSLMMSGHAALSIALFGSIWGLIEATIGGALHIVHIPFTGTIMASTGLALLFAASRSGLKPSELALVSLVAASFKFLDAPLFGIPPFNMMIINPAVAIASQGLAFALVVRFFGLSSRITGLAPRFLASAALGIVAFNITSMAVFGWQTNHTLNPWNAVLVQLPLMVIGATLLSKGASACESRVHMTLSPRWQAIATTISAVLAISARWMMHN